MIYLFILLTITQNVKDRKELQRLRAEEKKEILIDLLKEEKYEEALFLSDDLAVMGRIKILQGKTFDGLLDIEESALKGNVASCNLFLLSKMEVPLNDLKAFIKMDFGVDTTTTLSSPYTKYLVLTLESLEVELSHPDSLLTPFVVFQLGLKNIDKKEEKAKEYFQILLKEYPKSVPAIIARNLIRLLEEISNTDNRRDTERTENP
ncbi:hypothetical protein KAX08_05280 [candidate division WOR-3 bacterium]|nr:hypothetical protein [candidate division WOR-3 bacterium]